MIRLIVLLMVCCTFSLPTLAQQSGGATPRCTYVGCFITPQARSNHAFANGCTWNNDTIGGSNGNTNPKSCPQPGDNASTQSAVGDPIDLGTGNMYHVELDFIDGLADGLEFARSYNAFQGSRDIGIGRGWRHNWLRRIREAKTGLVTVIRPDGAHFVFQKEETYTAPPGVVDRLEKTVEGWRYTTGRGVTETYDKAGELQQVKLLSGRTQTLRYDEARRLHSVSDDRGRILTFRYEGRHVSGVSLPDGTELAFGYDEADRLTTLHRLTTAYRYASELLAQLEQWRNPPESRYHYEDGRFPHALTAIEDATGVRKVSWAYDAIGRAIMTQQGDGAEKLTIDYRDDTTVIVTNAVGHAATYTLEPVGDGRRRVVAITGKAGSTCPQLRQRNHFDKNGFLDLAADDDQQGRILQRNDRGLIETEYEGVHIAADNQWTPTAGSLKIERIWHPQLPRMTTAISYRYRDDQWQPVLQNTYTYDARGHVQSETAQDLLSSAEATAAPSTRQWTYARHYHDAAQRNLAQFVIKDPRGHATQLSYDTFGRLTAATNAQGQTTVFREYTAAHLPQIITLANGQAITLAYDDHQRMTSIARGDGTRREETRIEYLANGLVSHLQLANGSEFHFTYNAARQLTSIKNGRGETQTLDPSKLNGEWLNRTLSDASGNPTLKQQRRQDEWGRLLSWLGNSSQLIELVYNEAGDLTAVREGDAANADPDAKRTNQAKYDTLHRLVELIDAAGYRTQIDYSASGATEAIVDANGNKTEYVRNGFGEVLQEINPARGDDSYRYDAMGNIVRRNQTQMHYDKLNRLTTIDAPGEQDDIHYTYDQTDADHGNGIQQLTRIDAADHTIDYLYGAQGQLVAETTRQKLPSPSGRGAGGEGTTTLQYDYLPGGRLSTITYPDASVVQYRYDKERITDVTYTDAATDDETTLVEDINYAPFGDPVGWTYGNGLQQQLRTDLDGRIKTIALVKTGFSGDETLWSQRYGYDLYNNIERIEKDAATQKFAYDELHRLIGEQRNGQAAQFDYDGVGNRTRQEIADKTTDYQYNEGNRLTQRGDVSVALDGRGNLIEQGDQRFEYNSSHRPVSYYQSGKLAAHYGYNANGLRNHKTVYRNGKPITTQFAYAPDTRLLSAAHTDQTTHYIWLGHTPIAQIDKTADAKANWKTQIAYLHPDHLLTPRIATNDKQQIIWRWDSDAFGETKPETDPDKDDKHTDVQLRFPGQYADEESGLYYNVFRYYDPQAGRYTQSDPIGLAGGINTFLYANANPLRYIDPLGLDAIYINYNYYPVNTGFGFNAPLGHGGVVSVNPNTGETQYYEFGRYTDKKCGNVRRRPAPNVTMGSNGLPTQGSLDNLYKYLSEHYGHNSPVSPTYYEDSDYEATIEYAEKFAKEHDCYSLIGNNCKTFGQDAATACNEGEACK